jgi:predicted metal-dependent hydrolase
MDRGFAFNAHEVLEAAWKQGPDEERTLWQSLAQLAVGITHAQRGNVKGATSLLRSASAGLAQAERPGRHGIDVAGLVNFADALIDELAAGVPVAPQRLRPSLWTARHPQADDE